MGKYIKADWRAGSFIRTEFGFNAWIKDGHYLCNKKALQKLGQELRERNIALKTINQISQQQQPGPQSFLGLPLITSSGAASLMESITIKKCSGERNC